MSKNINKKHIYVFLNKEDLPEIVYTGHVLECAGVIPHDEKLAHNMENLDCVAYLREAEAFAAGYRLGIAEAMEGSK